jgi:hypothetical protein
MASKSEYAVIDAQGHYGDYTRVYSAHATLGAARKAQRARGPGYTVISTTARKGSKVHRMDAVRDEVR